MSYFTCFTKKIVSIKSKYCLWICPFLKSLKKTNFWEILCFFLRRSLVRPQRDVFLSTPEKLSLAVFCSFWRTKQFSVIYSDFSCCPKIFISIKSKTFPRSLFCYNSLKKFYVILRFFQKWSLFRKQREVFCLSLAKMLQNTRKA